MTSNQVFEAMGVLKEYRRLARLTNGFNTQIELEQVTIGSTIKPVVYTHLRTVELFETEKRAIIGAWQLLETKERTVLYYAYLGKEPMSMQQIASMMNYSKKSIEKWKMEGVRTS